MSLLNLHSLFSVLARARVIECTKKDEYIYNRKYFEELKRKYDDPNNLMYKKIYLVKEYCSGDSLLDFGCGTGDFINIVKDKFHKIIGLDISSEAVKICRQRFKNYSHIKIKKGSYKDVRKYGTFDCITSLDVIEHIDNISDCLSYLYESTNNGGRFIITTPNWYDKILRYFSGTDKHKHAHSSIGWKKIVQKVGYKPLVTRSVDFPILHKDILCNKLHMFGMCVINVFNRY